MAADEETRQWTRRLIKQVRELKAKADRDAILGFNESADMVVKIYRGLHAAVSRRVADPLLSSLELDLAADTSDRKKLATVSAAAAQLLVYLETADNFPGEAKNAPEPASSFDWDFKLPKGRLNRLFGKGDENLDT